MFSHFQMKKKFQSCNWIETNSSSMANALALNLILFKKNEKKKGNASTTYVKLIVEKMEKTPYLALKTISFSTSYDVAISGNPISNYFFA